MKHLILATVLLILYSCNDENKPATPTANDSLARQGDTIVSDSIKITTLQISPLNYSSWTAFWRAFKTAAQIKDTAAMLGLVNFPFFQNADTFSINEFREMLLSQLDGMEKTTEPIDADGLFLQGRRMAPPIDSIRYTNFDHRDYYFGKVNGFYKLVGIITPG